MTSSEPPEVVELRVHGVHGTSPALMLGVKDSAVVQVAGDGLTGVYRVTDGTLPERRLDGTSISVEAYSWGALTSGVQGFLGWVRRALWLLLLPFALVNLSYWARLQVGRATGTARWGARAVRLSGLLLTVFFMLTPCVVAIDLVGWQCYRYGVASCTRLPASLDFLGAWTPSRRLAAGSLVPLAAVVVLWLLSRQSLSRYEATTTSSPGADEDGPILRRARLWQGRARTERLQRLHLTAAVCTITLFVGWHALRTTGSAITWPWRSPSPTLAWTTELTMALILVVGWLVTVDHESDMEHRPLREHEPPTPVWSVLNWCERRGQQVGDRVRGRGDAALPLAAVALYLAQSVVLVVGQPLDQDQDYFGHNVYFIAVFVLLTALHLSVFLGGRMWSWLAVVLVLAPWGLGVGYAVHEYRTHRDEVWHPTTLLLAVLGYMLLLCLWHYRFVPTLLRALGVRHRRLDLPARHREAAWRGAGASVLLAAGAWVALLFTSTTVITAANWLNGPDDSVGDLVTRTTGDRWGAATVFEAQGQVTLRNAVVVSDADTTTVYRGLVDVDELQVGEPQDGARTSQGTTTIEREAVLTLPSSSVSLVDSCLGTTAVGPDGQPAQWLTDTCSAEGSHFRASADLVTPSDTVELAAGNLRPGDAVRMVVRHPPQPPLVVPQVMIWTPLGQLVWLLLTALAVLACVGLYSLTAARAINRLLPKSRGRRASADPAHQPPGPPYPDSTISRRDWHACRVKRRSAGLAHRAETLLDVCGTITPLCALGIIVYSATGRAPWEQAEWTRRYATLSMFAVIGLSVALVALGSQIRRSEGARKAVGVLWDLTTFWPRAAHPLAPPCYAERVVPELETRVGWALDGGHGGHGGHGGTVILSGHSQGSLIVVATASRLADDVLGHLRIITYGSQVRALYGRIFPAVFGPTDVGYRATTGTASLVDGWPDAPRAANVPPGLGPPDPGSLRERLEAKGGCWVNLFRRTDPLGWRVFSDRDSHLDRLVLEVPPPGAGDPGPRVLTHSGYQHSLVYRRVVADWTGEPVVEPVTGTLGVPPLPPV